jgi:hypothetical protein
LYGITYGNGTFVAVGAGGTILQSGLAPDSRPIFVRGDTQRLSDGSFKMTIAGPAGSPLLIEASVDLINWVTLTTLANENGTVRFLDPSPGGYKRFYRARSP